MSVARNRTPLQPYRLPHHGVVDRARRSSSNSTGIDTGFCRRYAGIRVARGGRAIGRPLVQVSPPARHRRRGIRGAECVGRAALGRPARAQHPSDGRRALRRARGTQPELMAECPPRPGAVNSLLSPIFVAGFYYKTFMWPAAFWEKLYEPLIRRAAGLGRASHEPDPDTYDKAHAFCDVLIIGGGPAGLAAALLAGARARGSSCAMRISSWADG